MEGVGDQLLARPVLPLDQNVRIAAGDAGDEVEHLVHLLAFSDDVAELEPSFELPLQLDVLVAQRAQLERPSKASEELVGVFDRFFDEVERACLRRLDRLLHAPVAGDDDDLRFLMGLLEPAQEIDAVDVGQHQVRHHHVRLPALEDLFRLRPDERRSHLEPFVLEDHLQPVDHRRFIVDRENAVPAFSVCCHVHLQRA